MSSEARLYAFSEDTKAKLRKFRLGTSRAKDPQAIICTSRSVLMYARHPVNACLEKRIEAPSCIDQIDKQTLEIAQAGDETFSNMQELADELPGHSPRFILLSYPLTLASGRLSVPYVLLYYLPVTCNAELRMLYAGAKELMRNTAEAGRVIELAEAEDLDTIEEKLGGEQ